MTSGKPGSNPPKQFVCKFCKGLFRRIVYPSSQCAFEFCSPACRNKARSLTMMPCPVCGKLFKPKVHMAGNQRKKNCSKPCADKVRIGTPSPKRTPTEIRQTVTEIYPTQGPEPLMEMFNLTRSAICQIAYKEGVKLDPDGIHYNRVYQAVRERMKINNPMKRPEVVAKVIAWQRAHPDIAAIHSAKARSKNQRENPSSLEFKLRQILAGLDIEFEPSAIIKPKFVVDIRIGNLIIQADGDYWHGHPRFEPLTDRQIAQQKRDRAQDAYLHKCGYNVVRIWESDMSLEKVISILQTHDAI